MKYTPKDCPKCGTALPKSSPRGGRPTRWCSEGCARSGSDEMSRVSSILRRQEKDLIDSRLRGWKNTEPAERAIAELQARFDHLAGVKPRESAD